METFHLQFGVRGCLEAGGSSREATAGGRASGIQICGI